MRDSELFPPISAEYAAAIGYVAAHWTFIEFQFAFLIYNLLGLHTIAGYAVTTEAGALQRLQILTTLIGLTGEEDWINEWGKIAKEFDALRNRRNDAVHAQWQPIGAEHWSMRIKARGQVTVTYGPVPIEDLKELSEKILVLEKMIVDIGSRLFKGGAKKIINQLHPPGPPLPKDPPPRNRAQIPKRERKRAQRAKARALTNAK